MLWRNPRVFQLVPRQRFMRCGSGVFADFFGSRDEAGSSCNLHLACCLIGVCGVSRSRKHVARAMRLLMALSVGAIAAVAGAADAAQRFTYPSYAQNDIVVEAKQQSCWRQCARYCRGRARRHACKPCVRECEARSARSSAQDEARATEGGVRSATPRIVDPIRSKSD